MKKLIVFIIVFLFIECDNSKELKISGVFENSNIMDNKLAYIYFDKDTISMKFIRNTYTYKGHIISSTLDLLKINIENEIIDIKVLKKTKDELILFDETNLFSSKDTVFLKKVKRKAINFNNVEINGFWFSNDFLVNENTKYWLNFKDSKLLIKFKEFNGEDSFQQFDYNIERFGELTFLNIPFKLSDAVYLFDTYSDEHIQLYLNDILTNRKYYIHLYKIDSIEYIQMAR